MNISLLSRAIVLSSKAISMSGRESERLFDLAMTIFNEAAYASPSNLTTFRYWAEALLNYAMKPREDKKETLKFLCLSVERFEDAFQEDDLETVFKHLTAIQEILLICDYKNFYSKVKRGFELLFVIKESGKVVSFTNLVISSLNLKTKHQTLEVLNLVKDEIENYRLVKFDQQEIESLYNTVLILLFESSEFVDFNVCKELVKKCERDKDTYALLSLVTICRSKVDQGINFSKSIAFILTMLEVAIKIEENSIEINENGANYISMSHYLWSKYCSEMFNYEILNSNSKTNFENLSLLSKHICLHLSKIKFQDENNFVFLQEVLSKNNCLTIIFTTLDSVFQQILYNQMHVQNELQFKYIFSYSITKSLEKAKLWFQGEKVWSDFTTIMNYFSKLIDVFVPSCCDLLLEASNLCGHLEELKEHYKNLKYPSMMLILKYTNDKKEKYLPIYANIRENIRDMKIEFTNFVDFENDQHCDIIFSISENLNHLTIQNISVSQYFIEKLGENLKNIVKVSFYELFIFTFFLIFVVGFLSTIIGKCQKKSFYGVSSSKHTSATQIPIFTNCKQRRNF